MILVYGFKSELYLVCFFFFFQAEDGIRDIGVTGVQTCALPILKNCEFFEVCSNIQYEFTALPLRDSYMTLRT